MKGVGSRAHTSTKEFVIVPALLPANHAKSQATYTDHTAIETAYTLRTFWSGLRSYLSSTPHGGHKIPIDDLEKYSSALI